MVNSYPLDGTAGARGYVPLRMTWRRLWLLTLLVWTVLGLMSAAQNAAWLAYSGREIDWGRILPNSLGDWLTCGMFTPAFYWMVRRFPIRAGRWWSTLPIHAAASVVFVVVKVAIWAPLFRLLNPGIDRTFADVFYGNFFPDGLAYWGSVGVIHAIEYYRVTTRLALENLRAQLQPHFLFNTLQSISTLIYRDQAAADRMLTDLSELLRMSLRNPSRQEVPLREELEFLERYLQIMRVRFGDRLVIAVDAGPDVLDALVPSLVLQPIVENAIQHGMADRPDVGHVSVRAVRDGGSLRLEVSDDGPGLEPVGATNGIGLANTRERIARLYGDAGRVEIRDGSGFTVRLTIPLR